MNYDVIIIGAGIVGGAVARELSKYRVQVVCLEKEADVCCGISKANTGIIHTPALVHSDTRKSEYTVRSNGMYEKLSSELGFRFQRTGALVLGFSDDDREILETYKDQGERAWQKYFPENGHIPEYRIIEKNMLTEVEPGLNPRVRLALHTPDAGRIIPYEYGIALWENAVSNGVNLKLNTNVIGLEREDNREEIFWRVEAGEEVYYSKYVVNAAGHGSMEIGGKAGFDHHKVDRVMGQYMILDRRKSPEINHILFQVPAKGKSRLGKGILVTNTVYGNLMIGPDARWIDNEEEGGIDQEVLKEILVGAKHSYPAIDPRYTIKTFAGIRPKPESGDFIVESKNRFINLCGIESPGLTSSPAIAEEVVKLLKNEGLIPEHNLYFIPDRKPIVDGVLNLEMGEVNRRIKLEAGKPDRLICRCEQVPEARIIDAINRDIPVTTLDGIKRRTRAGQGSCQGSFCSPGCRKLLSDISGLPEADITQRGDQPDYTRILPKEIKKIFD